MAETYTAVMLEWRKSVRNHRLLFGAPRRMARLDWRRRLAIFEQGDRFGYVRWSAARYGTVDWRVYILKAGGAGDTLCAVPGIRPGAHVLATAIGAGQVRKLLAAIDTLKAPCGTHDHVTDAGWIRLHAALIAGQDARPLVARLAGITA